MSSLCHDCDLRLDGVPPGDRYLVVPDSPCPSPRPALEAEGFLETPDSQDDADGQGARLHPLKAG